MTLKMAVFSLKAAKIPHRLGVLPPIAWPSAAGSSGPNPVCNTYKMYQFCLTRRLFDKFFELNNLPLVQSRSSPLSKFLIALLRLVSQKQLHPSHWRGNCK